MFIIYLRKISLNQKLFSIYLKYNHKECKNKVKKMNGKLSQSIKKKKNSIKKKKVKKNKINKNMDIMMRNKRKRTVEVIII